jgi:E3 ubiquitin-protein ligase RNF115/126
MLGMIFGALNEGPGRARGQNSPPDFGTLLAGLMGAPNGRAGDAVFTQEAFDQVMTQLMEQNPGSTAPPPATAEAVDALPRKNVTPDMMGNDGKVECSICMDDVEVGAEVTVLPCDHWFHHACIKHWLTTHDTCPHCRKPTSDHDQQARPTSRRHRSSTSRRPSSVSSPRAPPPGDGTRGNPFTVPDSPSAIRERRQQYFSNRHARDDDDLDRSQNHRSSSAQSTSRPSGGRQASSASNTGGGGGVSGWVRNHMPFGS